MRHRTTQARPPWRRDDTANWTLDIDRSLAAESGSVVGAEVGETVASVVGAGAGGVAGKGVTNRPALTTGRGLNVPEPQASHSTIAAARAPAECRRRRRERRPGTGIDARSPSIAGLHAVGQPRDADAIMIRELPTRKHEASRWVVRANGVSGTGRRWRVD